MYFVCVSLFQTEVTSFFCRVGIEPGHLRMHVWVCFSPSLLWVFQRGQCHHQRRSCRPQKRHLLSQPASKRSEIKPKLGVSGMLTNTIIILVCRSVDITAFSFYCSQWVEMNTVLLKNSKSDFSDFLLRVNILKVNALLSSLHEVGKFHVHHGQ